MAKEKKICKIDSDFEKVAAFWPPGSPDDIVGAILTGDSGRVELLTAPTFKRLDTKELREALQSFGKTSPTVRIEVLHGKTNDEPCSLFWLQEIDRPGVLDHGDGTQLSSIRYRVSTLVTGHHLTSADADEIDEAFFSFSTLHTFYSVPVTLQWADDVTTFSYPQGGSKLFSFCCLYLQAEVRFEVVPQNRRSHAKGLALRSKPRIHIRPTAPRSVLWYDNLRSRLENFFSLILGTSVATKMVSLYKEDVGGFLVERRPTRVEQADYSMRVACEDHMLAGALSHWLSIPDNKQPVEKTFLTVIRRSELFVETEFLSLAQAIEGFGRIHFQDCVIPKDKYRKGLGLARGALQGAWGDHPIVEKALLHLEHGNELSFADRISRMFDMLSPLFAERVFGEKQKFIRSIVQTRNFFTHPSIDAGGSVIQGAHDLTLFN